MKKEIKKIKILIKQNLMLKLREQRKLTKYYRLKVEEFVTTERKYNDELQTKQMEIRRLSLENKKLKEVIGKTNE